jgi:hypothetical protein
MMDMMLQISDLDTNVHTRSIHIDLKVYKFSLIRNVIGHIVLYIGYTHWCSVVMRSE